MPQYSSDTAITFSSDTPEGSGLFSGWSKISMAIDAFSSYPFNFKNETHMSCLFQLFIKFIDDLSRILQK